jgi:hypothetical protein
MARRSGGPGLLAARPDRAIPANSDKSRSTTRCIASGGYTVVGLSQISLFEPWGTLVNRWMKRS